MKLDLPRLADRLKAASERLDGVDVTVTNTDLIFSRGGFGTSASASAPLIGLFLSNEDLVGKALDRLEATPDRAAA